MKASRQSFLTRFAIRDWLILLTLAIGFSGLFGYVYSQRNVYHIEVSPGQSVKLVVQVEMQRAWRSKNFAKGLGLPVRCKLIPASSRDKISVHVRSTSHGLHRMTATLEIIAHSNAEPGRRTREVDFTIAGEGDWPRATVIITVR